MATIYDRSGEHLIICAVREAHIRPFQATDWTDLRVGFFLSLTQAGADNTITGLTETIGTEPRPFLQWSDRVQIGLVDQATKSVFCGYTNLYPGRINNGVGSSKLVSSDGGIGTTNTNYWRARNETNETHCVKIIDGGITRANGVTGSQMHFFQTLGGGGEYCTFFGLRFTRLDTRGHARIITMSVKATVGFSSDILFTATPTNAIGEAQLESFPTSVQQLGPVELSHVPDAFYFYWPFHSSRLRIHEVCMVKSA